MLLALLILFIVCCVALLCFLTTIQQKIGTLMMLMKQISADNVSVFIRSIRVIRVPIHQIK